MTAGGSRCRSGIRPEFFALLAFAGFLLLAGPVEARIGPSDAADAPPWSASAPGGVVLDSTPSLAEVRGWAAAEWDVQGANRTILLLVAERAPSEATGWVHLLTILERVTPASAPKAFEAVALADEGDAPAAVSLLLDGGDDLDGGDHGPLLALAALLAEEEDPTGAAALRERVIADHPEEPEVPELRLRQARWLLSIDARRSEGFTALEDLIVDHPEHPVAPEARRLLQLERERESQS